MTLAKGLRSSYLVGCDAPGTRATPWGGSTANIVKIEALGHGLSYTGFNEVYESQMLRQPERLGPNHLQDPIEVPGLVDIEIVGG